jgi:hypothetical protein
MRLYINPKTLFLFALSFSLPCSAADIIKKMVNTYRGATVHIISRKETNTGEIIDEYGTGFIVSKDGYVVTSCHTVDLQIIDGNGKNSNKIVQSVEIMGAVGSREGTPEKLGFVTCAQPPIDLALLKFANTFRKRTNIKIDSFAKLSVGDTIASMGYPHDLEFFPRSGTIGMATSDGTFTVDMTMQPGDSGAPVFSEDLKVVGVVESGYEGTQIGFVRPIAHAAGLLTVAGIVVTATNATISSAPESDEPVGSKVEVATSPLEAIGAFSAAVGNPPVSLNSEVKVTYPVLKLTGSAADSKSTINSSSVAVSEVKAKAGFRIIDAKFISLDVENAKVVDVMPSRDGSSARASILVNEDINGQKVSGAVRGFIETTQVPVKTEPIDTK